MTPIMLAGARATEHILSSLGSLKEQVDTRPSTGDGVDYGYNVKVTVEHRERSLLLM